MKRIYLLITAVGILLFSSSADLAQTTDRTDQTISDLLKEVRLLRKDLRQITASAYRANTLIERLRLQQGQINRLTQELNNVHSQLAEIKYSRNDLTAKLKELEKNVDAGLTPPAEIEAVKTTLANLDRREAELMTRDAQLGAELTTQQGALDDLSNKLDNIERELLTLSGSDDERPPKKNEKPERQ